MSEAAALGGGIETVATRVSKHNRTSGGGYSGASRVAAGTVSSTRDVSGNFAVKFRLGLRKAEPKVLGRGYADTTSRNHRYRYTDRSPQRTDFI